MMVVVRGAVVNNTLMMVVVRGAFLNNWVRLLWKFLQFHWGKKKDI